MQKFKIETNKNNINKDNISQSKVLTNSPNKRRNNSVDRNICSSEFYQLKSNLVLNNGNLAETSSPLVNAKKTLLKNKNTIGTMDIQRLGLIKQKFIIENMDELTAQKTINESLERINYYIKSQPGRTYENKKKVNQDTYFSLCNIMGLNQFHIFGVLDGHGE